MPMTTEPPLTLAFDTCAVIDGSANPSDRFMGYERHERMPCWP
jgi:hypothetical protein